MQLTEQGLAPTPENFQLAEDGLIEQTGAHAVYWLGRAATALYLAYRTAVFLRPDIDLFPEVIMPSMMCATAANTALLAHLQPRFADIDPLTGLVTLETIQARYTEKTIAVVVIHLYGQVVEMSAIKAWCKEKNILLIEDPTQALGAVYADGTSVGSQGDFSLYSFNSTKIISAGNGVLLANSSHASTALATLLEQEKIPFSIVSDDERTALALRYRNLHHAYVRDLRSYVLQPQQVSQAFLGIQPSFAPLYLRPVNPSVDLNQAWLALPVALKQRFELAEIYREALTGGGWTLLTGYQASGVCWRFGLLLDNLSQQVAFSEAVRQDGFHVSNLYWAVNDFFKPDDACPNADSFGRRIVNLWVDSSVDADYVRRCCDSLLNRQGLLI